MVDHDGGHVAAVRWWRKWWVWLIAGGVVLVGLGVAGIVTLVSTFLGFVDDAAAEEEARQPFELALDDLAQTAAVRYLGPVAEGVEYDLSVTSDGDAYGTVTLSEDTYRVLRVGDDAYLKPPAGTLAGPDATKALKHELDGRWLVNEGDLALPVDDLIQTPQQYADYLRSAFDAGGTVSTSAVGVDGVPALRADTWAGSIYVTSEPPYEILHVAEPDDSTPSAESSPSPESLRDGSPSPRSVALAALRTETDDEGAASEDEGADVDAPDGPEGPSAVSQLSRDEVGDLFDGMDGATQELKNAVNPSISFDLNGQAQVSCSSGGCTSNVQVTTDVSAAQGTVTGGTVTGELVSVFTVQGGLAGTCGSSSSLALKGTSSMSCSSPAAGGVFAAADAREGAQAQARANACRCTVSYQVPYSVDAQVLAVANVQVEVLRSQLGDRHKALMDQGKFCSFAGATPVLMGDGTRKPIQDIEVGDKVWAADPVSGERGPREVTHVWVHQDELFELEIDGETIVTTEDHPFWSVTDQRFERADELGAGERVLGAEERNLVVTHPIKASLPADGLAYNLTVTGWHTYRVGEHGVLVHNDNKGKYCDISDLKGDEPDTARRLMEDRDYPKDGGKLRGFKDTNNPDFIDQKNRTYDAVGGPTAWTHNGWKQNPDRQMSAMLKSIEKHIYEKQGNTYTVLDLTGASRTQIDQVFARLDELQAGPRKELNKLIILGEDY